MTEGMQHVLWQGGARDLCTDVDILSFQLGR